MKRFVFLWVWVVLGSCTEPPPPVPVISQEATSGICEHGIQKDLCTKCNPSLIPVFRAKGTYCEEHGFPEVVCPVCHPEKKGTLLVETKPPTEEAPKDKTKIRFKTKETATLAGIKTVPVAEHPSSAVLRTTATIRYDATKFAQINPRAAGVVRELKAAIGDKVSPSTPLATIQSASVGADRSYAKGSAARLASAKISYNRVKSMVDAGISPAKDLITAQSELDAAEADYQANLASLGEIDKSAKGVGGYSVSSPISGVILRRNATLGKFVDTSEILFEVADTSVMSVEIDIPESDLSTVFIGQEVAITVDALPMVQYKGNISYLSPEVNTQTRTVTAIASLTNEGGLLRANMFANALLLGETRTLVQVPRSSLQKTKGVWMVFVKLTEDTYEARHVTLFTDDGASDWVGIVRGVAAGEQVVTEGSFLLKTETLKDSIGAGCCAED